MARQKGLLKYVGTLSDVRHFKIKGQDGYFAGMVGGPTGEQVKSASEFERTRENMNEFGGCAKAGKSVRTVLSALIGSGIGRFLARKPGNAFGVAWESVKI